MGKRIRGAFTPEQRERWMTLVAEAESPEARAASDEYFRLAKEAAEDDSFSGELRRAIHSHPQAPLLMRKSGIRGDVLREFMMGTGTLSSDAIDLLWQAFGLHVLTVDVVNGESSAE